VPATIFGDVKPNDFVAQNEFFGPVIAVIKAKNLDEAIAFANSTEYALTGGLFSRSPANIQKVKNELEVGNMYINRGITGAMVDRHPFGGYKMSGIGSKTGGPDYLKQFVEPIVITENTMRRGFAPEEGE
jgi:RHH-type proline utilization regulon transcriptional repressor/proline dehydrogenase/delta 1-pyrroline-5-carboxylate dehydrogenase